MVVFRRRCRVLLDLGGAETEKKRGIFPGIWHTHIRGGQTQTHELWGSFFIWNKLRLRSDRSVCAIVGVVVPLQLSSTSSSSLITVPAQFYACSSPSNSFLYIHVCKIYLGLQFVYTKHIEQIAVAGFQSVTPNGIQKQKFGRIAPSLLLLWVLFLPNSFHFCFRARKGKCPSTDMQPAAQWPNRWLLNAVVTMATDTQSSTKMLIPHQRYMNRAFSSP